MVHAQDFALQLATVVVREDVVKHAQVVVPGNVVAIVLEVVVQIVLKNVVVDALVVVLMNVLLCVLPLV